MLPWNCELRSTKPRFALLFLFYSRDVLWVSQVLLHHVELVFEELSHLTHVALFHVCRINQNKPLGVQQALIVVPGLVFGGSSSLGLNLW